MQQRLSFYIDRDSFLHRLNPLTKLTLVFTIITLAFLGLSYWLPSILFVLVIVPLSYVGKISREFVKTTLRLLLPVVGFLFFMQAFFHPDGSTELFHIWILDVTVESVQFAYLTATRILTMVASFLILLLTTHPSDLMSDLTRRGVPGNLSYVITSTLQIIPQMQAKAATIIDAQRSRGLETKGNLINRTRALIPLVGPLVFGSLVEVEERAIAIEARAFTARIKKTSLRAIKDTNGERLGRWSMLFLIILAIGLRIWL
ncbi:MAG: energy-coupling factor transporter transmembrane protein EcfT [Chloroflexota bacterium]|nr:MAG: energy-coupling factor transporter transmembrane protein EcfT [Chloroflexota bacterium]